jgi:hypothetical protein
MFHVTAGSNNPIHGPAAEDEEAQDLKRRTPSDEPEDGRQRRRLSEGQRPRIAVVGMWPAANVGDANAVNGVVAALEKRLHGTNGSIDRLEKAFVQIDAAPVAATGANEQVERTAEAWLDRIRHGSFEKLVLIAAGSGHGLAPGLGMRQSDVVTVFTGHQLSSDIETAERLPRITALPESAVDDAQAQALGTRTRLLLTSGVPVHVDRAELSKLYDDYQQNAVQRIPHVDANTVVVILGGDAPDALGGLKRFTEADARRLARHVAKFDLSPGKARQALILNCRRTGEHDEDLVVKNPHPHRIDGLDSVTSAFEKALQASADVQTQVFDFRYGQASAYKPLLHALANADEPGPVHVSGDSPSMMSELTAVLPGERITIDEISSMNATHAQEVERISRDTGAGVLRRDGTLVRLRSLSESGRRPPAADAVADAIIDELNGKPAR